MANEKQFLNGVFADKKNGQYGEYFDLHIPELERFITNLRAFRTNSKGGLRFRMTEKQAKNGEMSIYFNEWEPTGQPSISQRTASPTAQQSQRSFGQKPAPVDNSQDLPF